VTGARKGKPDKVEKRETKVKYGENKDRQGAMRTMSVICFLWLPFSLFSSFLPAAAGGAADAFGLFVGLMAMRKRKRSGKEKRKKGKRNFARCKTNRRPRRKK
jgi:hypothetical protein